MFDSHAHIAFKQFNRDRFVVIQRAKEAGLTGWIEVGTDIKQSRKAVKLAEENENVWAAVGVHPDDISRGSLFVEGSKKSYWNTIERLCDHAKVKVIGEVGFDYYRGGTLEKQLPALDHFMHLARKKNLPMIFHIRNSPPGKGELEGVLRDANDDMLELLHSYSDDERPIGVMHSYSGSIEQARQYAELGMYLGISGVITFKNAGKLVNVVKEIPIERLLIETDCPFLAPEPRRGERNEPAYVQYVAQKIAELKGMSEQEVRFATEQNARNLFRI